MGRVLFWLTAFAPLHFSEELPRLSFSAQPDLTGPTLRFGVLGLTRIDLKSKRLVADVFDLIDLVA